MKTKLGKTILVLIMVLALLIGFIGSSTVVLADDTVPVSTQMAFCLDGSGSIWPDEWAIMINGLDNAIGNPAYVPQDGSVELSIIQFSTGYGGPDARLELAPTIVTDSTIGGILTTINGITQMGRRTNLSAGITLSANTLVNSPNYSPDIWQVINIVTDGEPNEPGAGEPEAQAAVDAAVASGIDEIDVETVGISSTNAIITWLATSIVYPDGTEDGVGAIIPTDDYPVHPNPDRGFVRICQQWEDLQAAIEAKLTVILQATTLTLEPPVATNPIDTDHTVTATLLYGNGSPVEGATISFAVTDGPNTGATGTVSGPTDTNGEATFTYTGTATGTDTITATYANGTTLTATAEKTWVDLTLTPPDDTNYIGETHTVTATIAPPVEGVLVDFAVTGDNSASGTATTDASGQAVFSYQGTNEGSDTITASCTYPNTDIVLTATATKTWTRVLLTLEPPDATNYTGQTHYVTATLVPPAENVDILFTVTGVNPTSGTVATDINGEAEFSWVGYNEGDDVVTATCTYPGTAIQLSATADKEWIIASTPPSIPSMTEWGILGTILGLAVLIPLTLKRKLFFTNR
jgi:hypothetical protein